LPQNEPRESPIIAITTTEHAGGTAWLPPRNCVARSMASVELCMPVQREIVFDTFSSCLHPEKASQFYTNRARNPQGASGKMHDGKQKSFSNVVFAKFLSRVVVDKKTLEHPLELPFQAMKV